MTIQQKFKKFLKKIDDLNIELNDSPELSSVFTFELQMQPLMKFNEAWMSATAASKVP